MEPTAQLRITRLQLKHYRSVGNCDLTLGQISFLVGPNGSGKSNVVDALKFLSQSLKENLDNALRQRGGVQEVRRRSNGHPRNFSVALEGYLDTAKFVYRFTVGSVAGKGIKVTEEHCTVDEGALGDGLVSYTVKAGKLSSNELRMSIPMYDERLALPLVSGFSKTLRRLHNALAAIEVYSPSPEAMRSAQTPEVGDRLLRDASNIASVVHYIKNHREADLEIIQQALASIVPGIQSVERAEAGSWETLKFKQIVKGAEHAWSFPATSVSDGTLRALGVLTAIYSPPIDGIYTPVIIEEPETALHPAASGILLEALKEASRGRQLIVTSHSPDLLDSEAISIDEVFAVRSEGGDTNVNTLDPVGQEALREGLFTVGQLLRVDQLQPRSAGIEGQGTLL